MKIIHIATDSKFIDHALPVFEKVFPNSNDVVVFTTKVPLEYTKLKPSRIEVKRRSYFFNKPKLSEDLYETYDLVIFHSLGPLTFPELKNISHDVATVWLGWGYDYYSDCLSELPLFLDKTRILNVGLNSNYFKSMAVNCFRKLVKVFQIRTKKVCAIEKISVFSPVLPEEYEMVKGSRAWKSFPEYASWNYGTLEDNFVRGFEGESVAGDSILIGNSATLTGNHVEAFDLLRKLKIKGRRVIVPLSYGDAKLTKKLINMGAEYFGRDFEPLIDFMPLEDYVEIIKKCGYVIMNHVRQQAVGNIVIMLYLGARVFVRRENPVYDFFWKSGVVLSTIQELEVNSDLLNQPLTQSERDSNREIISQYWSREKAYERTRELVKKALAMKTTRRSEAFSGSNQ
ncbi:TDP-N-acetylfucosamine:lipid II N-acetylfucosaminyltransferase [Marinobacter sp. Arc7-DN-1]|uniref:TDP-N-acetylfucosamine:lipid II N-acetylfucosaminyltransferase n=1 Tax=Marinobacter sp. Arc7-DN-1 TaxID=2304594 RepID=UPI000E43E10D|nr:TDP-N-acetylfucosamine:lipid II N-acetylfucosaminyltransferase [Marinobacter sp. Arc7-DN-1]AXS82517.1 4-alpha-L-fucosyltransferase (Fuc4NAc transferase) [Marinobacter sp. Arc7-DN-1]